MYYLGLSPYHIVCHVTGNIYSLVQSSPQTPKTIMLDAYSVALELLCGFLFHAKIYIILLLAFSSKSTQLKSSKLHDKFLILVTFLKLALIYIVISFKSNLDNLKADFKVYYTICRNKEFTSYYD